MQSQAYLKAGSHLDDPNIELRYGDWLINGKTISDSLGVVCKINSYTTMCENHTKLVFNRIVTIKYSVVLTPRKMFLKLFATPKHPIVV